MSALPKQDTTTAYVKHRLEQAGYALQLLPAEFPRGHKTAWPAIPRTSMEAWILQVQAEQDPEMKKQIAAEALRFKTHASREQIAALDEVMEWLYVFISDDKTRCIVLARSMPVEGSNRRPSYRKLGKKYGLSHEYARIKYQSGISLICESLNARSAA